MPWLRALLSLFVVFHLLAIALAPNPSSLLGFVLSPVYAQYTNIIGFNTPWNYFSPNPSENIRIDYQITFMDSSGRAAVEGSFPEWFDEGSMSPTERRELFLTRFLMVDQSRLLSVFSPWLCRLYPEANEIVSQLVVEKLPSIDLAIQKPSGWQKDKKPLPLQAFTHYCRMAPVESEAL